MAAVHKLKASEKQALGRSLVNRLRKQYQATLPRDERTVMDAMLFAICQENASRDEAEKAFVRLRELFGDLNEVRVSSISELAQAFQGMDDPEWRALRVRSVLQYVFERSYEFDFEPLRRKTHDLAVKQLERIRDLTPFVRESVLQEALAAHVVPVDDALRRVCVWLGLVPAEHTPEQVSEDLRSSLRKADVPLFCHMLRYLATDPRFAREFARVDNHRTETAYDPETALDRLAALFAAAGKRKKTAGRNSRSKAAAPQSARKKKKTTRRPAASPRKKK